MDEKNQLVIRYAKARPEEDVFVPTRRVDDSDYDLYASLDVVILPGQTVPIHTNLKLEFPIGWEGVFEEKSGLALKGISIHGGVIDHQYTGELIIIAYNRGSGPFSFAKGHKVAQIKLRQESPYFQFALADSPLRVTVRGENGFGSQGA
jgi:dUTP pyrophosphatase